MYGGESGTRTLKPLRTNGFQDRATTNYHNSPYLVRGVGFEPTQPEATGLQPVPTLQLRRPPILCMARPQRFEL